MEELEQCHLHTTVAACGQCAMCFEYFCVECLKDKDDLQLCNDHQSSFDQTSFELFLQVKTSANTPEAGVALYKLKEALWRDEAIKSYIKTTYELADSDDHITSYVHLFVDCSYIDKAKTIWENL